LGVSPIDIPGYKLLFSRLGAEAPEWVPSCRLGFGLKPVCKPDIHLPGAKAPGYSAVDLTMGSVFVIQF
jgi:hypothetical protein